MLKDVSIDGKSLTFALEKELSKTFLELAIMCKAVVCCEHRLPSDVLLLLTHVFW